MSGRPVVSVITIFWNAEPFLAEAIASVLAQTYPHWELLLVDDGSTDGSPALAQQWAAKHPARIRYLAHPGRVNRGMSASRNLGLRHARGAYIAFLDADDVWLPPKLERQVALLDAVPEAALVYGPTEWWYSWTGQAADAGRDFIHELGVPVNTVIQPPDLFKPFFLSENAAVPCTCSILVRRAAMEQVGGFEEQFRGLYEDQALYAKICLSMPVYVMGECLDRYRQRPDSSSAVAKDTEDAITVRLTFLNWLAAYLAEQRVQDPEILQELRSALRRCHHRLVRHRARRGRHMMKQTSLVLGATARRTLPTPLRRWLRAKITAREYSPPVGWVRFGNLRRLTPLSREFGAERGLPVDRYYIERFLTSHAVCVRGSVLEIADDEYTRRFGNGRVSHSDVLHIIEGSPKATIVGDLTSADHIPSDSYDCVILTQTLQLIYDVPAALRTVYRILKPGGVVLATLPGISPISRYDMERWGYFWAFTSLSTRRLFEEALPASSIQVESYGNVLVATSFLYGLSAQELHPHELDYRDPDYEVIIAVKAVKPIELS